MAAVRSAFHRSRPLRSTATSPAPTRTARCFMAAKRLPGRIAATSPVVRGPVLRRSRTARRAGLASALQTRSPRPPVRAAAFLDM